MMALLFTVALVDGNIKEFMAGEPYIDGLTFSNLTEEEAKELCRLAFKQGFEVAGKQETEVEVDGAAQDST